MRKLVNLVVIAMVLVMALFICTNSFAKTVIITTDGLNLRREASKSADVLEVISKDKEVELIEELAEWYKVKYAGMTGYISKDYAKIKGEDTTPVENNNVTNRNTNNTVANSTTTNDNSIANEVTNNQTSEPNVPTTTPVTTTVSTSKQMKIIESTKGYILPLINSNIIQEFKQNEVVTVLSSVNGWSYIESNVSSSWVRTNKLVDSTSDNNGVTQPTSNPVVTEEPTTTQEPTNNEGQEPANSSPQGSDNNETQKPDAQQPIANEGDTQTATPSNDGKTNVTPIERRVMYVQEPSVYVRSGPATTYDAIDSVVLNNTVIVTGEAGDWYQVEVDGKTGYIASWLLGKSAKETTSRGNVQRAQPEESVVQTTSNQVTSKGEQVVEYAKKYLGCKYVYGGSGPNTFDCSGFTMYVYKNFGVSLSHSATAQSNRGTYVAKEDLQPGDLVFFKDYQTMDGIGHCGIYIGGGEFIHASSGTGYCVKVSTLLSGSYEKRYETARRIF